MLTKIAGTIERIWTLGLKGVQLALDSTGLTADRTVTFPDRDLDLGNPFFDDTTTDGIFSLGTHSELTISGGAVTVTKSYHYIDTEADAATDDLDNLNGASEGAIVQLRSENGSRIVVITENGNIRLAGSSTSFDLDATSVNITLMKRSSNWRSRRGGRSYARSTAASRA